MSIADHLVAIESQLIAAEAVKACVEYGVRKGAFIHNAAIAIVSRIYGSPCGEPDCEAESLPYAVGNFGYEPAHGKRPERPSDPCRNCDWPRSCHAEVAK